MRVLGREVVRDSSVVSDLIQVWIGINVTKSEYLPKRVLLFKTLCVHLSSIIINVCIIKMVQLLGLLKSHLS